MYTFKEINAPGRHEWIKEQLTRLPSGSRLLDAGAGEQRYRPYCTHLVYTSQDFCQYNPEKQKQEEGLQHEKWDVSKIDIVSDITSIPVEDESFDAILCTEVFEHISNPLDALKEFNRILRKNGFLILTAPNCMPTHFAPYCYYTGFTRYFYEKELPANGFVIETIKNNGNYYNLLLQETIRLNYVSKRYSSEGLSFLERFIRWLFIQVIGRHNEKSKKSEELLCFGYFIIARKKQE